MRVSCVDCGGRSPGADGFYVLVGVEGWRPMRVVGRPRFDWRCPSCWPVFKEAMAGGLIPSASDSAASAVGSEDEPARSEGERGDDQELAQSGERVSLRGHGGEEDSTERRTALIKRMLFRIFRTLPTLVPSPSLQDVHAEAVECQSTLWRWGAAAPDRAQQILLVERLSRLEARLATCEPAERSVASGRSR